MTNSTVGFSDFKDSKEAGAHICSQILSGLNGNNPSVVIVFASSNYNYSDLLTSIKELSKTNILIGCSSAGEFTNINRGESAVSAVAIYSNEMEFASALGRCLRQDGHASAREIAKSLIGKATDGYTYRSMLLLSDALAGYTDTLIEQLTVLTGGMYQFFGGGAGDDAKFSSTYVFNGTEAVTDAVVALEILSHKPIGIGVKHGWTPVGNPMRVTASEGMKLISLNSQVASEAFEDYANNTKQTLDKANPIPFFLHNILGIKTQSGYKLRVPLAIQPDGSVLCASDIPTGSIISIMSTKNASAGEAATQAVESALGQIEGHKPNVALFFDCVATRLRLGTEFGEELKQVSNALGEKIKYVGCNSYGQIARVNGQFSGFHNCTAVVCIIPE